jgi:replicative DNA helicase
MNYEYQDQVLGMLLAQHKRYWPEVKHDFDPAAFGDLERIKIATKIKELSDADQMVNIATIANSIGTGMEMMIRLSQSYVREVNIHFFMSQLNGWYKMKNIVLNANNICHKIMQSTNSDRLDPLILEFKRLAELAEGCVTGGKEMFSMPEMIESTAGRIEERIGLRKEGKTRGASFGLPKLDYFVAGLLSGRFYIAAARTSVGKTSFASFIALQAMKQGYKPLFFSNEMDKEDLIEKFIAAEARISTQKFQSGDMNDSELSRFIAKANDLAKYKIAIDEKSGWDIDELLSRVHKQHRDGECDMVFVDYLQQVRVKSSKSKYEQVSYVSDAMKKLSRELNIPVVGLAQINRESEKGSKEDIPGLSHLKDSGSLEQDADVVMILHKRDISEPDVTLRIAKNRYGMTGDIKLRHLHQFNLYEEQA